MTYKWVQQLLDPFLYILIKIFFNITMNANDVYTHETIKQKLKNTIKKYIKLNKKKNSIENELMCLSRDIQKYKLSFEETA